MALIPPTERIKLCERGFLTFTFVRNPYERVLSGERLHFKTKFKIFVTWARMLAFLDKIGRCWVNKATGKVTSEAPSYEYYCVQLRERFKLKPTEPVTFTHFVRWLKTRRSDEFNQHWQSYRSRCGEQYILRFRRLKLLQTHGRLISIVDHSHRQPHERHTLRSYRKARGGDE
jgi:hypothetical protein